MGADDNELMQAFDAPSGSFSSFNGVVDLPDWAVVQVVGPDARTFLHGQLTQDVQSLAPTQARWAAYCTAQGRMLATFLMWSVSDQEVHLACSADLAERVVKRLRMFVLRARCQVQVASGHLMGLVGPCVSAWAGETAQPMAVVTADGATLVELPSALGLRRGLWWGPTRVDAHLSALPAQVWQALEVHAGVPRLVLANVEEFVPQMVNWELVGGVNFQKGCYPGQEVVARSQYRGTLKRRAVLLTGGEPLAPGDELFVTEEPDQPAGRVVLAAPALDQSAQWVALAEVRLSTLTHDLHAKTPQGAVFQRLDLPYAIAELG